MPEPSLVPMKRIERAILALRGHKVMLDADLAALYGVPVFRLNEQVRRNRARFPDDFMFQLNPQEFANLRRQFGASSQWGGRRSPSLRLHGTGCGHAFQRPAE